MSGDNAYLANNVPVNVSLTLSPGVYMFTESNTGNGSPASYSAEIVVFDRSVGYRPFHIPSYLSGNFPGLTGVIYHNFVDTNNAVFQNFTLMFNDVWDYGSWQKRANVSDIADAYGVKIDRGPQLCVWKLTNPR
jgi:hypothetical protein